MTNRFVFPNDLVRIGKYKGKTIDFVIDNDKPYFDWMCKKFEVNPLLIDLRNGIDIVKEEYLPNFIKESWTLQIRKFKFWKSEHVKFVSKSKKRIISNSIVAEYVCDVPFSTSVKEWIEHIDCTKFHNDSIEVERRETKYHYDEKLMEKFINEKINIHTKAETR